MRQKQGQVLGLATNWYLTAGIAYIDRFVLTAFLIHRRRDLQSDYGRDRGDAPHHFGWASDAKTRSGGSGPARTGDAAQLSVTIGAPSSRFSYNGGLRVSFQQLGPAELVVFAVSYALPVGVLLVFSRRLLRIRRTQREQEARLRALEQRSKR